MINKILIAFSAALVLGSPVVAAAMTKTRAVPLGATISVNAPNRAVVGYDTAGAAIFRGQLSGTCQLSQKQYSRC